MTYQSNGGEYSNYPEVVEAERAWDSPPQVRTTANFTEDHSLASKLIAQQHGQPQYNNQNHQQSASSYSQQPNPFQQHNANAYNQQQQQQQTPYDQQQFQQPPFPQHNSPAQQQSAWGPGSAGAAAAGVGAGTGSYMSPQSPTMTTTTAADGDPVLGSKEAAMSTSTQASPTTPTNDGGGIGATGAAGEKGSPKKYSRKVVWILIGLLILTMVLAGAIGGAVGTKAVNDAKKSCEATKTSATSTSTDSPTTTSSANSSTATFSVPSTGFVELACPSLDATTVTVDMGSKTWEFDMTCGASFSRSGSSDIMAVISYSFYHCLQACASLNQNGNKNVCLGAEFDSDLSTAFVFGGNRFLSNSSSEVSKVNDENANRKVSGLLQT